MTLAHRIASRYAAQKLEATLFSETALDLSRLVDLMPEVVKTYTKVQALLGPIQAALQSKPLGKILTRAKKACILLQAHAEGIKSLPTNLRAIEAFFAAEVAKGTQEVLMHPEQDYKYPKLKVLLKEQVLVNTLALNALEKAVEHLDLRSELSTFSLLVESPKVAKALALVEDLPTFEKDLSCIEDTWQVMASLDQKLIEAIELYATEQA